MRSDGQQCDRGPGVGPQERVSAEIPKLRFTVILSAIILAGTAATILAFLHAALSPYDIMDDAYIHFRMARNWTEHGLPLYNLNQKVAADSSPLWLLIMGAVIHIPAPIEVSAFGVEILAVTATAVIAFLFLLRCDADPIWAVSGSALVFLTTYSPALNLMETPLAVMLAIIAVSLYCSNNSLWAVFAALAVLTRLEFVVLVSWLILGEMRTPLRAIRSIVIFVFLTGACCLWYWDTFGSLLPGTIEAKRRLYQVSSIAILNGLLPGPSLVLLILSLALLVCRGPTLMPLSDRRARSRSEHRKDATNARVAIAAWGLFLGGVCVAVAYLVEDVLVFPWYRANIFPIMLLGIVGLISSLRVRRGLPLQLMLIGIALPFLYSLGNDLYAASVNIEAYGPLQDDSRVRLYIEVGKALAREKPDGSLLSSEIGGLGWGFPGQIYDAAGLVSPGARRYHPMKVPEERSSSTLGSIPPLYFKEKLPDFVVSLSVFAEALERDETLDHLYSCERRRPISAEMMKLGLKTGAFGAKYLLVCRKRSKPINEMK